MLQFYSHTIDELLPANAVLCAMLHETYATANETFQATHFKYSWARLSYAGPGSARLGSA